MAMPEQGVVPALRIANYHRSRVNPREVSEFPEGNGFLTILFRTNGRCDRCAQASEGSGSKSFTRGRSIIPHPLGVA